MSNIFRHWLRIYNNFSKGDRNTIISIGSVIFIGIVAITIIDQLKPKPEYSQEQYEKFQKLLELQEKKPTTNSKSLFYFDPNSIQSDQMDSLDLPDFVKNNVLSYRNAGGRFSVKEDFRKIYGMNDSIYNAVQDYIVFENAEIQENVPESMPKQITGYFDPNLADFEELIEFGFSSFQAGNIMAYKNKGGVFYEKTDLLKIYGVDSSFYNQVEKHVNISHQKKISDEKKNRNEIKILELNSADSIGLEKLRGIGPVYAKRIIKYRELLGGFYSTLQLLEVYSFPTETYEMIKSEISVDTLLIRKIRINFAEYSELIRHPYLNKQQVEAILKFRNQSGAIKNIHQLERNGVIDNEVFRRIRPYLTCR